MHTFEILPAKAELAAAVDYAKLSAPFQAYVDREVDLVMLFKEVNFVGIGAQYLPLDDLSLHPLKALRLMGCSNVSDLANATQYECGFTGTTRYCFLPLGIVTSLKGLCKYHQAFDSYGKSYRSNVLHVIPAANRFRAEMFQLPRIDEDDGLFDDGPYNYERGLSRVERLYLGSGASLSSLAAGEDLPQLGAVALRLSNEDGLVGVAYRQPA